MGPATLEVPPAKPGGVSVPALTLGDICQRLNLPRVDHIKLDIEGAEYEALPAAASFIERYRPDFLVEAHLENDGPINVPRLEKFFAQFGYKMKFVPQPGDESFPLLYFWPTSQG